MKKQSLGRGLDALLGAYEAPVTGVQEVDIYLIDNNENQPRKEFDEEKLRELADSIKRHGIVQPIIVNSNGDRYSIVAGERRYRAARIAGLTTVPVIVREMEDVEIYEVALIENIQRENLNPIEEAAAIRFLMDQYELTQEEISQRLGKSRPAIANLVRLLNLPEYIREHIRSGKLLAGHAKVLAGIKDEETRDKLAVMAVEGNLSVRELEEKVQEITEAEKKKHEKKKKIRKSDAIIDEAAKTMQKSIGTKVKIVGNAKRGKVVIEYYSAESLQTVYDAICGKDGNNQ